MSVEDVVVLGGGILGVSAAAHLAAKDVNVTLVTEAELGSGASGRSLSWLNAASEQSAAYRALRLAGIDRYRELLAAEPEADWLAFDGGIHWSADPARTRSKHRFQMSVDYPSRLCSPENLAEAVPGVNADAVVEAAVVNSDDGWVSLPHLIAYLAERAAAAGARFADHAGECSVILDGSRAVGIRTEQGEEIRGDKVLVACGPQTSEVLGRIGVAIPDASPLSMLVVSEPVEVPSRFVFNTPRAAVRPNPGGTLAIDHSWYEDRIMERADGGYEISREIVDELVSEAACLYAGVPDIRAASWRLGRKPIPGDGQPVFGELEAVPGCYVAFTHSGATLGLIAGELMANELADGIREPMLNTFRPERFGSAD